MKPWPRTIVTAACLLFGAAVGFHLSAIGQTTPGNVSEARVLAEASQGNNWLVVGGSFGEQHFSPLKQITDRNIDTLGLAWLLDIDAPMGMSAEPIVVDGVAYVTAPQSRVYAVDAASGKVLWTFDPKVRIDRMRNSFTARANRGVSVWAGKVYVGTGDCRLVAIDAASGSKAWESPVCDETQTGITSAPRVGDGKIFMGYNGSDTGVRGSVAAFDPETGKELWRFWTVPGDPARPSESKALEMAAKTWEGEGAWRVGGADVWEAITYDPVTGLVFLATSGSNPSSLHGDTADLKVGGDRLFSGSVVAVTAKTGEYVWHYQTSTRTENMHVLVADLVLAGGGDRRRVAMTVPKTGVFYVFDARTGELISEKPLSDRGPHHNWWPMSYSPVTGLVYVPARERRDPEPASGNVPLVGKLFAWDPLTKSARWTAAQRVPANGGVLSTAGNLVFEGEGTGELAAYAADSGRKVWSIQTGSAIQATPVSYMVRGEQYILVPVGWGSASRLFARASLTATPEAKRGPSRLLAFKLGARTPFPTVRAVMPPVPRPPAQTYSADMIEKGRALYNTHFCFDCHSPEAEGTGAWVLDGAVPDLRFMPMAVHRRWNEIVLDGSSSRRGMPGFRNPPGFPVLTRKMTQEEADAIHAYVIDLSWKAYKDQQSGRIVP